MSDLATHYDDGVLEPDEETLMSALRNQDDIPILMDIVAERESLSSSQEAHLEQSFSEHKEQDAKPQDILDGSVSQEAYQNDFKDESSDPSLDEVVTLNEVVAESALSQELIAKTIADVLEKRLPELVSEVMQALHAAGTTQKE
ncbi:hypothetical protein [Marinomonas polaris]|uniref:Uncharacterized protein n=1 Tax=Marinomonas polaris DSM 16579 TaxID=1122206 RepID=A0A1M5MRH2_9GAMM|nr:hypothetical protein [Marinomonas polaris]SHG80000.1 hypothetical protein SAMN02745753_04510 [Marinomonas polaris DSM 16579]|tara:strand:- start:27 stop:458 length:432 start_codon:yes stop_codon:yes gene_type:complete